jgi:predicted dehydrogenase
MDIINLGEGPRWPAWLTVLRSHPQVQSVALVSRDGAAKNEPGVRRHPTLSHALQAIREPMVIATGNAALDDGAQACEALAAGLDVILDRPDTLSLAALMKLAAVAQQAKSIVIPAREDTTGSITTALRSLVGKVGSVTHVSFIDRRPWSDVRGNVDGAPYLQLTRFGLDNLESVSRLFDADAVRVMARCTQAPWSTGVRCTTTEVFLELKGNIHVQYFGCATSSQREQSLWIESVRGSLRSDGTIVWWRKRGWPRFVPWRWRPRAADDAERRFSRSAHASLALLQQVRTSGDAAAKRAAFSPLALLGAVIRSHEEGRAVDVADWARPVTTASARA